MKKFTASLALSISLAASCIAGDVQTPGYQDPPPPPPPADFMSASPTPGEIPSMPGPDDSMVLVWDSAIGLLLTAL